MASCEPPPQPRKGELLFSQTPALSWAGKTLTRALWRGTGPCAPIQDVINDCCQYDMNAHIEKPCFLSPSLSGRQLLLSLLSHWVSLTCHPYLECLPVRDPCSLCPSPPTCPTPPPALKIPLFPPLPSSSSFPNPPLPISSSCSPDLPYSCLKTRETFPITCAVTTTAVGPKHMNALIPMSPCGPSWWSVLAMVPCSPSWWSALAMVPCRSS